MYRYRSEIIRRKGLEKKKKFSLTKKKYIFIFIIIFEKKIKTVHKDES
jgi:hypothetical protein